MPLSNEDSLRLNILCNQAVKAIRINDSSMLLTALTDKGEARIELTPNIKNDRYLREVREFLSERFLGMPGGFPKHLGRWTRMGDSHHSADKMLLLGEVEAVVALAYSCKLDAEQAAQAWWAYQSPEIARNLLNNKAVIESDLGKELASFLLEFLPFEPKPLDVVHSVKQCLQGSLITDQQKADLWRRAKRKNPFYVGFLLAGHEHIPLQEKPHANYAGISAQLSTELEAENAYAEIYLYFMSSEGRKWLKSLQLALQKLTEPDIVIALFITIDQSIELGFSPKRGVREISQAIAVADQLCAGLDSPAQLTKVCSAIGKQQHKKMSALLMLAQIGEHTLNEVFGGRDATGSVMRKHLKPLTNPINTAIETLLK